LPGSVLLGRRGIPLGVPFALVIALVAASNPFLVEGRKQFKALEFRAATESLKRAASVLDQTDAERIEAHDLLAQSYLALGRDADAVGSYEALLKVLPHAPTPQGAPKIRDAFLLAKEKLYPKPAVTISRVPSAEDVWIFEWVDPWSLVARVAVNERSFPAPADRRLKISAGAAAPKVEVRAFDEKDTLLATLRFEPAAAPAAGGAAVPEVQAVAAARRSPAPWVLVGFGAASLIAGGALLGVAFAPPPNGVSAAQATSLNQGRRLEAQVGWPLLGAAVVLCLIAWWVR
jgi:hypothetical protein